MCGIAGIIHRGGAQIGLAAAEAMSLSMRPRGPDDSGAFSLASGNDRLVLTSRRLAIIDPTDAGHQPMCDGHSDTTIVFNGMIYNFRELRGKLAAKGAVFSSDSDTEVVLQMYASYGPSCVEQLRGMFAFAIWDSRTRELFLARDRLGIKPLYYFHSTKGFLFASQVKALLKSGLVDARLSLNGLVSYLDFGAVSEPLTIIDGVRALPAGHTATLRDGELQLSKYWEPHASTEAISNGQTVVALRAMLDEIVDGHLVSDAPLGVFLSGGLDSSVLAALAARQTERLKTISVVFGERAYSEERYIDSVTRRLGVDHVRVSLSAADLRRHLADAFVAMDQPSFDGINTFFVSKAAHEAGLKVALSGLGADELFDGYGNTTRVARLEQIRRLPKPLPQVAAAGAAAFAEGVSSRQKLRGWVSGSFPPGHSYELLRRLFLPGDVARLLAAASAADCVPTVDAIDCRKDVFPQVSMLELTNYTKNVLLRDTDAMSMANSLEVRVPYLDHRLVEWALGLPRSARAGKRKGLLVAAARDALPKEVLERKKQGFLLPLESWMAGDLGSEAAAAICDPPSPVRDLVNLKEARTVWTDFSLGARSWLQPWALYALCMWVESLVGNRGPSPRWPSKRGGDPRHGRCHSP
jgi:asparagine synthase (glutamine-hydrolysing)